MAIAAAARARDVLLGVRVEVLTIVWMPANMMLHRLARTGPSELPGGHFTAFREATSWFTNGLPPSCQASKCLIVQVW